jgi:hypothetical protein
MVLMTVAWLRWLWPRCHLQVGVVRSRWMLITRELFQVCTTCHARCCCSLVVISLLSGYGPAACAVGGLLRAVFPSGCCRLDERSALRRPAAAGAPNRRLAAADQGVDELACTDEADCGLPPSRACRPSTAWWYSAWPTWTLVRLPTAVFSAHTLTCARCSFSTAAPSARMRALLVDSCGCGRVECCSLRTATRCRHWDGQPGTPVRCCARRRGRRAVPGPAGGAQPAAHRAGGAARRSARAPLRRWCADWAACSSLVACCMGR